MATTKTPLKLNRYGFPLTTCHRCGGTGSFGPTSVKGGVCFECTGQKMCVRRGKAAKAWAEFAREVRSQTQRTVERLVPGDVVRGWTPGDAWLTVDHIEVTDSADGWSITREDGVEVKTEVSWRTTLHFTDGTTQPVSSRSIMHRRATRVDPAPFLATIPKAAFFA